MKLRTMTASLFLVLLRNDRLILRCLVVLTIALGAAYSVHLGDYLPYADEQGYCAVARNLVEQHSFSLDGMRVTAYRPPGYPVILALLALLHAGIPAFRMLNFMALGLTLCVVYSVLKEQSSRLAGILGVLLVVCYPVLFYTAGTLFPQTVGAMLFLAAIRIVVRQKTTLRESVSAGLLFGLLMLIVPSFAAALVICAVWKWLADRPRRLKPVAVTLFVAFLLPGLWCARNYRVYHRFVFVSSNSGVMMLYGNSENTTRDSGPSTDISKYRTAAAHMNDVERDAYYKSSAIRYVLGHKVRALRLYALKVLNYFNYINDLKTHVESSSSKNLVMLLTYGPLLFLFALRLMLAKRFRLSKLESLAVLLYLSNAFVAAMFFTRVRYRLPFDFLLILVVATFIATLIAPRLEKDSSVSSPEAAQDRQFHREASQT